MQVKRQAETLSSFKSRLKTHLVTFRLKTLINASLDYSFLVSLFCHCNIIFCLFYHLNNFVAEMC